MKYKQALSNLGEFKFVEFKEIDSLISALEGETIRKLAM